MISHKYKCIFIHIPKCAGTSIESALGHYDQTIVRDVQDHRSIRMIERPLYSINIFRSVENMSELVRRVRHKYRTVANPNNRLSVTKEEYEHYFKFTIIRNPWARAYSWYKNVIKDEIHQRSYGITSNIPLNTFLRKFAGKGMLSPQLYWIKNFNGNIPLDFIGRFEHLREDFQIILEKLNISHLELPHKMKGGGKGYKEYFDNESIKIISEVYEEEIKMFGYNFDE